MTTQDSVHPPLNPNGTKTTAKYKCQITGTKELSNRVKKKNQRSSSFHVGCPSDSPQSYSQVKEDFRALSISADFTDVAPMAAANKQSSWHAYDVPSTPTSFRNQEALMIEEQMDKSKTGEKPQQTNCTIPLQWSKIRKGIRRRKVTFLKGRSFSETNQKRVLKTNCLPGPMISSSKQHPWTEIDHVIQHNICSSGFSFACLIRQNGQRSDREHISHLQSEHHSNASISEKYKPKFFEDIIGHDIIKRAISNAVHNKSISNLYLFHGPSGTGKTSTARIFSMALNCESISHAKPCWSCKGCSRSLCIKKLCSGSKSTGFDRIKTLLQSTSFTQTIPGIKVMIIEECHSLTAEAWDELWGLTKGQHGSTVIFVLITVYAHMVPRILSSRCQKFFFPKLRDIDIRQKLARIISQESITIEIEALELVITKAEGSLREAENVLDQLRLLGTKITTSMVQQLVGLVSQDKLIDLLTTAISGDNVKTIRFTRDLIATGIEPQALVAQLLSLITDIISNSAVSLPGSSTLAGPSDKTLQTTSIYAALLQIASEDVTNRKSTGIVLSRDRMLPTGDMPNADFVDLLWHKKSHSGIWTNCQSISQASEKLDLDRTGASKITKSVSQTETCKGKAVAKEPNSAYISDMEEFWLTTLKKIQSKYVKEFLSRQAKLASLTVSSTNAIVHLIFKRPEDKLAAQMSEESIARALENVIGRHVTVNVSLEPSDLGNIQDDPLSEDKNEAINQRTAESIYKRNTRSPMRCSMHQKSAPTSESINPGTLKECKFKSQGRDKYSGQKESIAAQPRQILPFLVHSKRENNSNTSEDPKIKSLTREWTTVNTANIMRNKRRTQRWLSLSSIQQSDASVEAYSQDILFENANKEKECRVRRKAKHQKGVSEADKNHHSPHSATGKVLHRSWSCTELERGKNARVRPNPHAHEYWMRLYNKERDAPCSSEKCLKVLEVACDMFL